MSVQSRISENNTLTLQGGAATGRTLWERWERERRERRERGVCRTNFLSNTSQVTGYTLMEKIILEELRLLNSKKKKFNVTVTCAKVGVPSGK